MNLTMGHFRVPTGLWIECSAFDMEMIFHSHANKTDFHKKVYALGRWPIIISVLRRLASWYSHIKGDTV